MSPFTIRNAPLKIGMPVLLTGGREGFISEVRKTPFLFSFWNLKSKGVELITESVVLLREHPEEMLRKLLDD